MSRQRINGELHRARAQVKALRRRPKVTGKAEIAISALIAGDGREEIASELEVGVSTVQNSRPDIPSGCKLKCASWPVHACFARRAIASFPARERVG